MVIECILLIIKLDVVVKNVIGQIYSCFEGVGLKIVVLCMVYLLCVDVEKFYVVYVVCLFFKDFVDFMILGLVMIQVLEGEGVILKNCDLMGVMDLKKVEKGMICVDFVDSIDVNVVYGLDVVEMVVVEIVFFFLEMNVYLC